MVDASEETMAVLRIADQLHEDGSVKVSALAVAILMRRVWQMEGNCKQAIAVVDAVEEQIHKTNRHVEEALHNMRVVSDYAKQLNDRVELYYKAVEDGDIDRIREVRDEVFRHWQTRHELEIK